MHRRARYASQLPTAVLQRRAAVRLQIGFRNLLARRAAQQARRLLVDDELLRRLAGVIARAEFCCAEKIQWRWRLVHKTAQFRESAAMRKIKVALSRRRAWKVAQALELEARQQQAELGAAIRLQAGMRRLLARKYAVQAAKNRALGLLREQWGANREARAVGRVQRAWVASVARRREAEAAKQAATAELLEVRLARARSSELRTKHYAVLIARQLKRYLARRIEVSGALRGWLSKRVRRGSLLAPSNWRRRFFWVSEGALRYESIERRNAHLRGWPLRQLCSAAPRTRAGEFELVFRTAGIDQRQALTLRATSEAEAEFWYKWMRWLAHLAAGGGPAFTPVPKPPKAPASQLAALAALRAVEANHTGEDLVIASVQRRLLAAAHARGGGGGESRAPHHHHQHGLAMQRLPPPQLASSQAAAPPPPLSTPQPSYAWDVEDNHDLEPDSPGLAVDLAASPDLPIMVSSPQIRQTHDIGARVLVRIGGGSDEATGFVAAFDPKSGAYRIALGAPDSAELLTAALHDVRSDVLLTPRF